MKPTSIRFTLLAVLATTLSTPAATPANGSDTTPVVSKISDVTVYADRARVTRRASVSIHPGLTRLAFPKLPGWIDEGSVRVALSPADAGELTDVQVEKTFLARPDDQEIREAEAAVTDLSDQLAALDDQSAALEAELKQTDAIRVFSLDKLPKDAAVREVKVEEYGAVVKFIGDTTLEIAKAKRELEKKRRDLQPELRVRQQRLNELRQRAQLEQRTVVVTLQGGREAQANLSLTYLLPGTTWEPMHELRTSPDGRTVTLASYAVVTQTTGEDWDGAALSFSTQRPNATERIPELEGLLVGGGRSLAKALHPEGESFQAAVANFEGQNAFWNDVVNAGRLELQQSWAENVKAQRARQAKVVAVFQQVQQRGTTAQFAALTAKTVHTDGRPVRVPIGEARLESTPRIVAAPELSLNAVQTAELNNTCGQPLLPGKVLLYAEGAFVGTTETEFVGPGENFSLFLGVADQLKLARTLDQKRSSLTWTGKRKRLLASLVLTAENLSAKPVGFQLADRIPVSETEEIRVTGVKVQPEIKPDAKGRLKWDVVLPPKEKKEFHLEYTLEYPPELPRDTAEAQRKGAGLPAASSGELGPSSPPSQSLNFQIEALEKQVKRAP